LGAHGLPGKRESAAGLRGLFHHAAANMHRTPCVSALSFWTVRALLGGNRQGDPGETSMAMTMNGEVQLAAPREAVWAKLNDPEVLRVCIPGCEELEKPRTTASARSPR